jgi:hypothetical protein
VIWELRGFKPGTFPDYDRNFEDAQESYRRIDDLFRAEIVDLWNLPKTCCSVSSVSWMSSRFRAVGLTEAAASCLEDAAAELMSSGLLFPACAVAVTRTSTPFEGHEDGREHEL